MMLGRRNQGQRQLFYEFRLDEAVPDDHLVRDRRSKLSTIGVGSSGITW
jgi:hypothetical protein